MSRDVFLPTGGHPDLERLTVLSGRAEALGYDRVWCPETWGRDAVTVLAAVTDRTERIGIGTSVLPVYSRSPALLGQTAATLQELSGGRFRLGLGPSGQAVVEGWHGVPFGNPLRRTRETVEIVKAVVRGERVEYRSEGVELAGFRLRGDPPDPPPAVDAAGMGPKAVELAGRFADGWHALMVTHDGLRTRLEDFRRGAALGDREPASLRVTVTVPCMVDANAERARRVAREHLAFYVGAMGRYYRETLARQGYESAAHDVAAKWGSGEREAAIATVPEALLDAICAVGTPAHARDRLESFEAIEGVDAVSVAFPRGADPQTVDATLEALAP